MNEKQRCYKSLDDVVSPMSVGEIIGRGYQGKIYAVGPDRILKVIRRKDKKYSLKREAEIGRKAHQLGIGPYIYDSGYFIDEAGKKNEYIYMQRLKGKIFKRVGYKKPQEFAKACELYYKLTCAGIYHNDTNSNNFMYDDNGKLYVIDYGLAKYKRPPQSCSTRRYLHQHMFKLLNHTFKTNSKRYKQECIDVINEWMKNKYKDTYCVLNIFFLLFLIIVPAIIFIIFSKTIKI